MVQIWVDGILDLVCLTYLLSNLLTLFVGWFYSLPSHAKANGQALVPPVLLSLVPPLPTALSHLRRWGWEWITGPMSPGKLHGNFQVSVQFPNHYTPWLWLQVEKPRLGGAGTTVPFGCVLCKPINCLFHVSFCCLGLQISWWHQTSMPQLSWLENVVWSHHEVQMNSIPVCLFISMQPYLWNIWYTFLPYFLFVLWN